MSKWSFSTVENLGGRFQIVITKVGRPSVDVTYFRNAPTKINSYSNGDPFGDAACVLSFPQITGFDDLDSQDVGAWLGDFASVDIWWVPAQTDRDGVEDLVHNWISPLTNQLDVVSPIRTAHTNRVGDVVYNDLRIKVWEGFITSMDLTASETDNNLQVQCQGALYQLDRYLQKPFYPPRPVTLESLLQGVFDKHSKPHLRTAPLVIQFPVGWTKLVPPYTGSTSYTPNAKPGTKWTGYTSRNTGGWDRSLTGFSQDLLAVMLTQNDSGVTPGNQWTIAHQRQAPSMAAGRQPVLLVRDRKRLPDFTIWLGAPGVNVTLSRDTTQVANIIYGDGTGTDGTVWRNAVISNDGSRTDYNPLAASPEIYPYTNNKNFSATAFASEAYYKYGSGFNQDQAIESAGKSLQRDRSPGWSGTLVLKTDPSLALPRFLIRAGMTVKIMGIVGTGDRGMNFHIASVEVSGEDLSVSMKIDTRYRDLLNLEEALARTRDPLTPSKMLQLNRASVMIEDVMAPWDYTAGSGFVPKASTAFHAYKPVAQSFPNADWMRKHPPFMYPHWYIRVNANAPSRKQRWTGGVPILTSEKGTIRRTEFVCVDKYGNIVRNPFHVSLYYTKVDWSFMPFDSSGPSPYITGAFENINPITGQEWGPDAPHLRPQQSMIIGWGNYAQRAGFSPGRESDGASPTGILVDESTWTFDNTNNPNFNRGARPGQKQSASAITIYAMLYADYTEPLYFMGRLYRQEPGT